MVGVRSHVVLDIDIYIRKLDGSPALLANGEWRRYVAAILGRDSITLCL